MYYRPIPQERDSYKSIIESYEAEVTLNVGRGAGGAGDIAARRIEQQEAMLDTHRQQAAMHDRELEARADTITTLRATVSKVSRRSLIHSLISLSLLCRLFFPSPCIFSLSPSTASFLALLFLSLLFSVSVSVSLSLSLSLSHTHTLPVFTLSLNLSLSTLSLFTHSPNNLFFYLTIHDVCFS
jgi:hypothetical protein